MAFIVCISAAMANVEETSSSLAFATRAITVEQAKANQKHIVSAAAAAHNNSSRSRSPGSKKSAGAEEGCDSESDQKPKARAPWMEKK